ncbi:MAG TPA: ABC transporter ATP-binding protein, partial [Deltaproteobacteria bacterium]|nr:ABC transporter ATP-binding protein [Deltaproteobacteria bacterium]
MRPFVPLIEARDLRFTIGDKTVLSGVNLLVHEGEYISVIGPNGSGKTSLLRCLVRIARHTSGRVILSGRPIESFTRRELACMVSYVPQSADSFLPFSVWEFVFSGRYAHLGPLAPAGSRDREAVERSLDLTGTTGLKDRPLATLSGGERQRVFIAAALAQESRIMLLDEPTTAL